jgi:hypothetical protein
MRRCRYVPWLAALFLAWASHPATAQSPGDLLGRWKVTRIVDAQGEPDDGSEDLVAFTFTGDGVLRIERSSESREAGPSAPEQARYRTERDKVVLIVEGETVHGQFWFEGGGLIILDQQRGITAYFRRSAREA